MTTYYTYVSVNKKNIRVTETEQEHKAKVNRMRYINRLQEEKARNERDGWDGSTTLICTCGTPKPMNKYVRSGNWKCKNCGHQGKNYTNGGMII
jgi:hypothetical protein